MYYEEIKDGKIYDTKYGRAIVKDSNATVVTVEHPRWGTMKLTPKDIYYDTKK